MLPVVLVVVVPLCIDVVILLIFFFFFKVSTQQDSGKDFLYSFVDVEPLTFLQCEKNLPSFFFPPCLDSIVVDSFNCTTCRS